jgi:hypothetical protein
VAVLLDKPEVVGSTPARFVRPQPPTGGQLSGLVLAQCPRSACAAFIYLRGLATQDFLRGRKLALALLVARVLADHHDPAITADHFALFADLLDARLDLHGIPLRVAVGGLDRPWLSLWPPSVYL